MVVGGRGKGREAQVKASTVRKRNQLQPRNVNSPASQQKHHRLGRVKGGGARPGWGSSRQSLKNRFPRLCAKAQSRGDSGTCAVVHAEVGSDKPPTPKMSTP